MPTSKLIDQAKKLMEKRLAELDDERTGVERALAELGGKAARRGPDRSRGRGNGKPAGGKKSKSDQAPKRRKRRGGTRADQAVALIQKEPGIGASNVAKKLKIKRNYIYRVLGDLEKEGRVKKDGRQFFPPGD
jgi:hypothetical protein